MIWLRDYRMRVARPIWIKQPKIRHPHKIYLKSQATHFSNWRERKGKNWALILNLRSISLKISSIKWVSLWSHTTISHLNSFSMGFCQTWNIVVLDGIASEGGGSITRFHADGIIRFGDRRIWSGKPQISNSQSSLSEIAATPLSSNGSKEKKINPATVCSNWLEQWKEKNHPVGLNLHPDFGAIGFKNNSVSSRGWRGRIILGDHPLPNIPNNQASRPSMWYDFWKVWGGEDASFGFPKLPYWRSKSGPNVHQLVTNHDLIYSKLKVTWRRILI